MRKLSLVRLRNTIIGMILLVFSGQTNALTINTTFAGGAAPGSAVGPGNVQDIFGTAADWWESAILDPFTLNLTFQWGALGGGTLGLHQLQTQAGGRETSGLITFDNDGTTDWWLDGTPADASEFSTFTESSADLGGGLINTGRVYTGATGLAVGNFDLFNTAIHEIGHALGMSSANFSYQGESWPDNDVDVAAPLPFAGTVIQTRNGNTPETGATSNAHFLTAAHPNATLGRVVSRGSRYMLTCVDILANAQISGFSNIDCDPDLVSVPEPGTIGLIGLGLLGLAFSRRRSRYSQAAKSR